MRRGAVDLGSVLVVSRVHGVRRGVVELGSVLAVLRVVFLHFLYFGQVFGGLEVVEVNLVVILVHDLSCWKFLIYF